MDSTHPDIVAYAEPFGRRCANEREAAVALYYAIRDAYRYDPYAVNLDRSYMKASAFLHRDRGYCIEKANLLGACARALGIPARLGFGDVRNHIGTEKLERRLGTNLMVFHGYTELWLEGRWVKATPAFNSELCAMLGVEPLDFDGISDSVFQAYSPGGASFMVYERDRGTYAEWPVEEFEAALREHYGHLFQHREAEKMLRPLQE
jgi:transglutaminase-like putative cysteine protease